MWEIWNTVDLEEVDVFPDLQACAFNDHHRMQTLLTTHLSPGKQTDI